MSAPIHRWLAAPLDADVEASLRRLAFVDGVVHVAVMPDVHLAREVCVGTVVATRGVILPAAVGGDIGCGMAAAAFDTGADVLRDERVAARLLGGLARHIPSLKHREAGALPDGLAGRVLSDASLERRKHRDGRVQLGTLGRGNHFVELQGDEDGRLWLMVHSGSRGMGVAIREHHERAAARQGGLATIDAASDAGQAYLSDHAWALLYAETNRARLVAAAAEVLHEVVGATLDDHTRVTCHHNHVGAESHGGETLLVHRKGAIRAGEGEAGIIPGSMGTASYHTRGRGHPEALCSSAHGAGRTMSRTEARRRISAKALHRSMRGVWYDHRHERRLVGEAPAAYRDIGAVMRAQRDLTRVVRRLQPLLSFKGP